MSNTDWLLLGVFIGLIVGSTLIIALIILLNTPCTECPICFDNIAEISRYCNDIPR